jgi:hypothetical protein
MYQLYANITQEHKNKTPGAADTGEKMVVQWDCTSAIYRFQESL